MPDLHDSSFKLWFDHAEMVRDLLRGFVPEDVVEAFDFDTLEQLPAEYIGDDLRQSRGDMVWRVRFRGEATGEWLYLLVLLEFQSTVDRHMAARVLAYTAQTFIKLIRNEALPADGRLPPVLPVVIYNGRTRWSAPEEMGEAIAAVGGGLAPFQPRQRYLLLDQHAMRVDDLPPGNVVSAQIELEQGSVSAMAPVLRKLGELLNEPRHGSLRQAFAEWVRRVVERSRLAASQPGLVDTLRALEETGDLKAMGSLLAERIDEYADERLAEGLAQGKAEGLDQERALLSRLTARKFDAGTAARLAALLEGVDDPERLAEVGEQVIDCVTGAELLARAERAAGRG